MSLTSDTMKHIKSSKEQHHGHRCVVTFSQLQKTNSQSLFWGWRNVFVLKFSYPRYMFSELSILL